jgi:hypothetical protein
MSDLPHVVDDMPVCGRCEKWGTGPIVEGVCKPCREEERLDLKLREGRAGDPAPPGEAGDG